MMDTDPTLYPVTGEDLEILLTAQAAVRRKFLMYSLGSGMTIYLWWSNPFLLLRLILGFLGLLQLLAVVFLFLRYRAFKEDIAGGMKLLEPGVVENREAFNTEGVKLDPSRPVFFLRVNGREVGVKEDVYQQYKEGDPVQVAVAPNSSHVLGVTTPFIQHGN